MLKNNLTHFLETHFWLFLILAMALGLVYPVYNDALMTLLEPALMLLLFLVFLKIDLLDVLESIKDYRLMSFLSVMYLLVFPVLFYYTFLPFGRDLAVGMLLLTAMPAASASPALTDILKGNTPLSMSIAILTSLLAPFTVPFLFRILGFQQSNLDLGQIFYSLAMIVFVPMVLSQLVKRYFPRAVERARPSFTPINILILFLFVYTTVGSQRSVILEDPLSLVWDVVCLYLVFILLHLAGYLLAYSRSRADKIAITIGNAYMNNGMAIVLAASYFEPSVLILMVLSEFPWNSLLGPFRTIMQRLPD